MRKINRPLLIHKIASYLLKKQQEVESGRDVRKVWEYARKTKTMKDLCAILRKMAGSQERCMYCEDSRGTDVEHFWPIASYKQKAFLWDNLLWICTDCNRQKTDNFALDDLNNPLLINPTSEDPWDYLFFDSETAMVTARYQSSTKLPHPKGTYTISALPTLNYEVVINGRQRTKRNLKRAVNYFLEHKSVSAKDLNLDQELVEVISDNDSYGMVYWYFVRDGQGEIPFSELQRRYENIWLLVVSACLGQQTSAT